MSLLRKFNDSIFLTIGEVIEFFQQVFEGLQSIHSHHIVHKDVGMLNIMMDPRPLFPKLYHPLAIRQNRTMTGFTKYYTCTVLELLWTMDYRRALGAYGHSIFFGYVSFLPDMVYSILYLYGYQFSLRPVHSSAFYTAPDSSR
ncbi:hypothetical protein C8Q74DRAFT_1350296 [Fomes fomentarius]|nr:hypothetical protein C8Q74DRAFT_1350296 [Fomes fomentarius]